MGKKFGNLAYVTGIVKYSLSPFEMRAFAGMLSKGLPNVFKRTWESSKVFLPRKYYYFFLLKINSFYLLNF